MDYLALLLLGSVAINPNHHKASPIFLATDWRQQTRERKDKSVQVHYYIKRKICSVISQGEEIKKWKGKNCFSLLCAHSLLVSWRSDLGNVGWQSSTSAQAAVFSLADSLALGTRHSPRHAAQEGAPIPPLSEDCGPDHTTRGHLFKGQGRHAYYEMHKPG